MHKRQPLTSVGALNLARFRPIAIVVQIYNVQQFHCPSIFMTGGTKVNNILLCAGCNMTLFVAGLDPHAPGPAPTVVCSSIRHGENPASCSNKLVLYVFFDLAVL